MEQRKHPRFPVRFRSSFSSANLVAGEGTLEDLSIRGCRVHSPIEVKPGTALELRIHFANGEPPVCISQAIARWCRTSSFGLEFITLAPEEWARLQHVVKDLELEPYAREQENNQEA